jgi:hypothetical protein
LPAGVVALDSPEGAGLIQTAEAKAPFLALVSHFESQKSQAFCGIASAVMVLNALAVPAPVSPAWAPYRAFTQDNIFDERVLAIATPQTIGRGGLTLAQLRLVLQAYPVRVERHLAADLTLASFRALLVRALGTPGVYLIANLLRDGIGEEPTGILGRNLGGHFSPLGAYNAAADRVLILDVARYKYPAVWVTTSALWAAIHTPDLTSGESRGVLLVKAAAIAPPPEPKPPGSWLPFLILGALLLGTYCLGAATPGVVGRLRRRFQRR